MDGGQKEVVFTLKLIFPPKSAQIGTVEGRGIQRKGAETPIRKIKPANNHINSPQMMTLTTPGRQKNAPAP